MKIYYISPRDIFKGRVDVIMAIQTCYSLSKQGHDVELIAPTYYREENISLDEIWDYYSIPSGAFKITNLPTRLRDNSSPTRERIEKVIFHFFYSVKILAISLFHKKCDIAVISHCLISCYPYLFILALPRRIRKILFLFDLHTYSNNRAHNYVLSRMDGILYLTQSIQNMVESCLDMPDGHATITRHGVDINKYNTSANKSYYRHDLGLDPDAWIAMYTGKVSHSMKEIQYIIKSASLLSNIQFIVVGGKQDAIDYWEVFCRENCVNNIAFTGFIAPVNVIKYQLSSDCLIMYYPGDWPLADFLSPGKMTEYMAAGKAILCVDFPVIREVLRDGVNSLLIEPDRPDKLATAIMSLRDNHDVSSRLGHQARKDVSLLTWDKRASHISDLLEHLCNKPSRVQRT